MQGIELNMNPPHWSEDRYWLDGQDKYQQCFESNQRFFSLDVKAIQDCIYQGDGPAYKLLEAMLSVDYHEGMEGYKGAPRIVLALLAQLAELGGVPSVVMSSNSLGYDADKEIIYVLKNPAMPGLLKIGKTSQSNVTLRMNQLYATGVPTPFECVYAVEVDSYHNVENALHIAFGPNRINPNREFFQIEEDQAVAILKVLGGTDVTPHINAELTANVSQAEKESGKRIKKRPNIDFFEMGLSIGDQLMFKQGEATAEVFSNKKVLFNGAVVSLTAATREVLNIDHSVQPTPYWVFEKKLLKEIYEKTYPFDENN